VARGTLTMLGRLAPGTVGIVGAVRLKACRTSRGSESELISGLPSDCCRPGASVDLIRVQDLERRFKTLI